MDFYSTPTNRKPSVSVHHLSYVLLWIQSLLLVLRCRQRDTLARCDHRPAWTFDRHISAVVKSCNYHLRALQHIRHLLPFSTAQTLACSLILSRLDYCNAVLYSCSARARSATACTELYAARQTGALYHSRYIGCSSDLFTKQHLLRA